MKLFTRLLATVLISLTLILGSASSVNAKKLGIQTKVVLPCEQERSTALDDAST